MTGGNQWPLNKLQPNPLNPRADLRGDGFDELVASIETQGILQPILISRDGLILAGHRRYEAAKLLGLESVPIRIIAAVEPEDLDVICLIENLMRSDLGALETADYLLELQERRELDPSKIAAITGISIHSVRKYLKLAQMPDEMRGPVRDGKLTLGAAIDLIRQPDAAPAAINQASRGQTVSRAVVKEIVKNVTVKTTYSPSEQRQTDVSWAIDQAERIKRRLARYDNKDIQVCIERLENALVDWGAAESRALRRSGATELRVKSSLLS